MAASTEDYLQYLSGDSLQVQRATSRNLSALHPMFPEGGLVDPRTGHKVPGIYIGQDMSGGNFFFDVYQLYQANILHNLNIVLLGKIDHRKSSLLKTYILRLVAYGYNVLVTDIKGEYDLLAHHIGDTAKVLRFGPDSDLRINPLDKRIPIDKQIELIGLMAVAAMGEDHQALSTREIGILKWAIKSAHEHYGPGSSGLATLPDLVAKLKEPDDYMVTNFGRPRAEIQEHGIDLAIGLEELTQGGIGAMCSGETTAGLYEETPFLSMNLKEVPERWLPIITTIHNFFTSSQFGTSNSWGRFHFIIHDEAWQLAKDKAFVQSLVTSHKLGRTAGVCNISAFHHLQTLYRSGNSEVIKEVVVDSETRIIYAQDETELDLTANELNLNDNEIALIPDQPPGRGLWKMGRNYSIQVQHEAFPFEIPLLETSHLAKGVAI